MAKVGFVGLGTMGLPMAGHLFAAGTDLVLWNRTPAKADPLKKRGAHVAESLEELGRVCGVVCMCVPRTEDVQECLRILTKETSAGTLFIDHSTILPMAAKEIHAELGARGMRFVDAPITGGSMGAQKGQLTIFCGGDEADVRAATRIVAPYAKRAERVGGPGAGQMMKMVNQIAVAGALLALCESLAFAEKAGLDLRQTKELVGSGAAGSWAFENYGPKILAKDWSPGFTIENQVKDLKYCLESAEEIGAELPGTALVDGLLEEMAAKGDGGKTTAALFERLLGG
jgi:3-hydroxyisobutyrate dehydrogenase-like beta-hydroxyacid dehydrogenase